MGRSLLVSVALLTAVGCAVDEGTPVGAVDGDGVPVEVLVVDPGPAVHGPSFMHSDAADVYGIGCAYGPEQWLGEASEVLSANFDRAGLAAEFESVSAVRAALAEGGAAADLLALRLSLALNDAGVFGQYANLGGAFVLTGHQAGIAATILPSRFADLEGAEAITRVLGAFDQCPADYYVASYLDVDGDGVIGSDDCDDLDPNVGTEVFADDLSAPDHFTPTPELGNDWLWDGDSAYATGGGQEAMLGDIGGLTDIVVYSDVTANGTKLSCGFDCEEQCGDYEPVDGCYTGWQALALGILTAEVTAEATLTYFNSGAHDVCLDSFMAFDTVKGSQGAILGETGGAYGGEYRIPAGGSLDTFFGSYTTDNNAYAPHLGEDAFWCVESGTPMPVGGSYLGWGALAPDDIRELINNSSDLDLDGIEDHLDYERAAVMTQHNVWDYQEAHAAVMIGKLAHSEPGVITVDLHVENRGAVATTAVITDVIPAQWELVGCSDAPDGMVTVDGTTELTWNVTLGGCTDDCAIVESADITCDIRYLLPVDADIIELPAANAAYFDGSDDEVSWSGPAVAFDYDQDGDGVVLCGRTDRWRTGVLARADFDVDQDEGYHGVRCALAKNSEEDCFDPGWFVQIGAFLDASEDDISSECDAGCPPNTTFDQLARVNHDGMYDLSDDLNAHLRFYAVGEELVCEAYDNASGTLIASARATSSLFASGGYGMSTLNMFGDYDSYRVCEAYATP
jgi:hypothetical protein